MFCFKNCCEFLKKQQQQFITFHRRFLISNITQEPMNYNKTLNNKGFYIWV